MNIERNSYQEPPGTIEEFADLYGLTMQIVEYPNGRFTAQFKNAEIKDGPILSSNYGVGRTEEQAILDYALQLSGRRIVLNSTGPDRRLIDVPDFRPTIKAESFR